jgi:hypothetical protein
VAVAAAVRHDGVMRQNQFTRPTIAAALNVLKERLSAANLDMFIFELGLSTRIDASLTSPKKAVQVAYALENLGDQQLGTLDGVVTMKEAVVRKAVTVMLDTDEPSYPEPRLRRALALDGFVVDFGPRSASLRAALPEEIEMPQTDDEVHELLRYFGFSTTLGHLEQAIDAHTQGNWASANAQARTFIESLLDELARRIDPDEADAPGRNSENRRQLLRQRGFLREDLAELTDDGKSFIHGFFKMLHSEGSHPGLSGEDRSTCRLHLILVTSRMLLRRLRYGDR